MFKSSTVTTSCHKEVRVFDSTRVSNEYDLIRLGYYPKWRDHQESPYRNIDPESIVRQAVKMGVSVLEWAVPENHIFIEWEGVQPHPAQKLYNGDLLADVCSACRRHGVKILLCWATNAIHEDMKDWLEKDVDTLNKAGLYLEKAGKYHNHICPNYQRHRDWVAGYVTELASRYDIDGFIFDGPWFRYPHVWPRHADGSVACQVCCDAYKRVTGKEVPLQFDWALPEFRDYISYFKKHVFRGYMEWLSGIVRKKNPDLFISYNSPVYVWGGWGDTCPWNDAGALADSFYVEMHLGSREELQPVLQLKLNRAALGGKPPEMYCKTYDLSVANFAYSCPPECEVKALGYLTLSEAGILGIHSSMDENGRAHPERTQVFEDFGKELKPKLHFYVNADLVEHAGIHLSDQTRDLYAGENPNQYLVSPVGTAQILAESQRTYGFLLDDALGNIDLLNRYPTVVLANSACLSEEQTRAIREYVQNGGTLLVTGETSLYDEHDRFRGEFSLADVLGVGFKGVSSNRERYRGSPLFNRYPFLLHNHAISSGLQDRMISRCPWFSIEAAPDREVVATWADVRPETDFACVNGGLEILGDTGEPAIVAGSYGRGKVIYFSFDLTGQYMYEMNRHIRMLVARASDWLCRESVEVVNAPKHIHFAVTRQKERSRIILHFVNILFNNKSANEILGHGYPFDPQCHLKRLGTAPSCYSIRSDVNDDLAEVIREYRSKYIRKESYVSTGTDQICAYDEVIPIRGIKIRINTSVYPFRSITDIESGEKIKVTTATGGWCEISLPELAIYRGLAIQL